MQDKPWEATEHGRKVLQTEDELNAYIAAYGEMHIIHVLTNLSFILNKSWDSVPYNILNEYILSIHSSVMNNLSRCIITSAALNCGKHVLISCLLIPGDNDTEA